MDSPEGPKGIPSGDAFGIHSASLRFPKGSLWDRMTFLVVFELASKAKNVNSERSIKPQENAHGRFHVGAPCETKPPAFIVPAYGKSNVGFNSVFIN
jgi:hypothetical protein